MNNQSRARSSSSPGAGDRPPVAARFKHFVFRLIRHLRSSTAIATSGRVFGDEMLNDRSRIVLMGSDSTVSFADFQVYYRAIIWLSYRRNFPHIPRTLLSSDAGWGCMLRSLQMVIAHAFQRHYSSSEWNIRTGPGGIGTGRIQSDGDFSRATRHHIIQYFADDPVAPYSIHKLVELGSYFGKKPGQWYGPSLASHVARSSNQRHIIQEGEPSHERDSNGGSAFLNKPMAIFTAQDGVVSINEIDAYFGTDTPDSRSSSPLPTATSSDVSMDAKPCPTEAKTADAGGAVADASPQEGTPILPSASVAAAASTKSALLLIPLRLGVHRISPQHLAMLRETLQLPQSVGFIGGSPAHSLYFVGADEHGRFACLDPHTTQRAIQPPSTLRFWQNQEQVEEFAHNSTRPSEGLLRFLPGENIDPTLAVAFFFSGHDDFLNFQQLAKPFSAREAVAAGTAIFSFSRQTAAASPNPMHSSGQDLVASCMFPAAPVETEESEQQAESTASRGNSSDDEYVLI